MNFERSIPLGSLTPKQFMTIATEAIKKNGWKISYVGETMLSATTTFSMRSFSEEVGVKIENGIVVLKSESSQVITWGKNRDNIENLIVTINELKNTLTPKSIAQKNDDIQIYKKQLLIEKQKELVSLEIKYLNATRNSRNSSGGTLIITIGLVLLGVGFFIANLLGILLGIFLLILGFLKSANFWSSNVENKQDIEIISDNIIKTKKAIIELQNSI